MINMPDAERGIKQAQADTPDLGMGLHLTLTAGRPALPATEVPDLVGPDGLFRRKGDVIAGLPTVDMLQVERELRAQIARFEEIAGRGPDHLDSHHHITYLSPPMVALMGQLARDLDVPIRRPLPAEADDPARRAEHVQAAIEGMPNPAYAAEMANILTAIAEKSGLRTPDAFVAGFYGQNATLGDLLLILVDLKEGVSELMCHPAEVDDALRDASGYTDRRGDELAALTAASTREVIQTEFIQLITFADLK